MTINWSTTIGAILLFVLGLLGNLFVQWWLERKKFKRIKGAINYHLTILILDNCALLKAEYEKCIPAIQNRKTHQMGFKAFETFDAEIYKANNPADYFKIYGRNKGRKFQDLISIYSVISFLKDDMPFKVHKNYVAEIENHLDKNVQNGDDRLMHVKTCQSCCNIQDRCVNICNMRMAEVDTLIKLIQRFIN